MKHELLLSKYPLSADTLQQYAQILETKGIERGLIGPREIARIWDRHIVNCALIAELVPPSASVIDIGSGAGLPGLVLAIIRSDLSVTLIEPLLRRSEFLNETIAELGLVNVQVLRERAEQSKNLKADVVTARAVAPLNRLLTWALPLMKQDGQILAMKGASAATEITEAKQQLKGYEAEILQVGAEYADQSTSVVRVTCSQ